MPVLSKKERDKMEMELRDRFERLIFNFQGRELSSAIEGLKRKARWINPDKMCATNGTSIELNLAVSDFNTILNEIKKLK